MEINKPKDLPTLQITPTDNGGWTVWIPKYQYAFTTIAGIRDLIETFLANPEHFTKRWGSD